MDNNYVMFSARCEGRRNGTEYRAKTSKHRAAATKFSDGEGNASNDDHDDEGNYNVTEAPLTTMQHEGSRCSYLAAEYR